MSKKKTYLAVLERRSSGIFGGVNQLLLPVDVEQPETPLSVAQAVTDKIKTKGIDPPQKLFVIDARVLNIPKNWKEVFAPQVSEEQPNEELKSE